MLKAVPRTALACLLLFHSSDGSLIRIESTAVTVVKGVHEFPGHLATGTKAVIYTLSGRTFAVRETDEEVARLLRSCNH
jgi:hypothetical protein